MDSKSSKDKQLQTSSKIFWTAEEQQRLEALLLEYPPEAVEARRWEKIARALGNRTTLQVLFLMIVLIF